MYLLQEAQTTNQIQRLTSRSMKQQGSTVSFHDKYNHILNQKHNISAYYSYLLSDLSTFHNQHQPWRQPPPTTDPNSLAQAIQLQTLYKLTMPAIYSLDWPEQINYKTTSPITAVVAFKQLGQQYHSIDQSLVSWVESGGTKVLPLRSSTPKEKVIASLKVASALVVPDCRAETEVQFVKDLAQVLKEQKELPVLAIGSSAILLMAQLNNCQQLNKKAKFQPKITQELQAFSTHSDPFFSNLNLQTRLEIQNKYKILSTPSKLDLPSYVLASHNTNLTLLSLAKQKSSQYCILLARQQLIHYSFFSPKLDGTNMDAVTFGHKVIVSFLEEVRKRVRNVDEKQIEVGQYKIILKGQRYVYNCDVRLAKL